VSGSDLKQRLAAILAADAAGFSRLMSLDERATVAALDAARVAFRKHIESNQGRVIDMAGDSVLAVFETAVGAVSAALAVQGDLDTASSSVPEGHRMRFRVGVHLGDVIEKADGTVYGDGVNIAARLEGLAEPGGIAVSDSVRNAVRGKVNASFDDLGEQTMKNIADPVRAFRLKPGSSNTKPVPAVGEIDLSLPNKPSIAVLPFANMSGDPEQEYFTDGVTEEIITELSRFHSLFVIARNSTFTYKGKAVDVRTVSKELGVRYVLEGSIRKASTRIRVTAQLIDAVTGNHIWAEKFDRVLEDIFAVQEEVTQSIVAAIAPQIDTAEQEKARRRRPENLTAHDIALRAVASGDEVYRKFDLPLLERALAQAREALALDPRNALALNLIAGLQAQHLFLFTGDGKDAQTRLQEGLDAAAKAIELDPSGSPGYAWTGMLLSLAGRGAEALANARRGYELNPNDVLALRSLTYVELMEGRPELSLEHAQYAVRLSPRDPFHYRTNAMRAAACFLLRDHAQGIEFALLSVGAAPNWPVAHMNHVLVAVGAGDMASAKAALETARRLAPEYVQRRIGGESAYSRPEDRQRVTTAFRIAAGLEDPSAADALR